MIEILVSILTIRALSAQLIQMYPGSACSPSRVCMNLACMKLESYKIEFEK